MTNINHNYGGAGGVNNFQSTIVNQVFTPRAVSPSFNMAKEELSFLLENNYMKRIASLNPQEQQQFMLLLQLQEQVKKENPDKSTISQILPAISAISGAVNIAKTLKDWVSGLS